MRYLLLCVLGFALASHPSHTAAVTGTLHGVVRDAAGAILPGAVVFIHHWKLKDRSVNRPVSVMEPAVRVDSKGQFSVHLPPGVYEVFVAYPVFAPYSQRVKIEPRKQVTLECELPFDDLTKWVE